MKLRNARRAGKEGRPLPSVPDLGKRVIKSQLHDLFYSNFGFNPHFRVFTQHTTKKIIIPSKWN